MTKSKSFSNELDHAIVPPSWRFVKIRITAYVIMMALLAICINVHAAAPADNNATVKIRGGHAQVLAACVNYARVAARHHRPAQSNYCSNSAETDGGTVSLSDVSIFINQKGRGK